MHIIGITGTLGAGKGTIVEYLKRKGFTHYSVSGYLKTYIQEQGLPVNRDTMIQVSNTLRKEYGPAYLVEQVYKNAKRIGGRCVIESIRTIGEIELLKQQGDFTLWAVDADQELRYTRIIGRNSEKDHVSFEKFQAQEEAEFSNTEPHKQNLLACMQRADIQFDNNGSIEELHQEIDKYL